MKATYRPLPLLHLLIYWLVVQAILVGWPSAVLGQSKTIEANKAALCAAPTDSARASRALALGNAFIHYSYDSALHYFQRSIVLSATAGQQPLLTYSYLALGHTYLRQGDAARSLPNLRRAESLHPRHKLDSTALEIGVLTAIALRSEGNYAEGLRRCLNLLRAYEPPRQPRYRQLGMVYTELGVIYDHLHQYDKAALYHRKQLAFAEKGSNRRAVVVAHLNLGAFYSNIGRYQAAERHYLLALSQARRHGYRSDAAVLLSNLGDLAYERHRYGEAIARHTETVQLARQSNEVELHGWNLLMLAKDHQALRHYATALAFADRALVVYETQPPVDIQQQALTIKAELLAQVGRYREALEITQRSGALKDSIMGIEKQKAIASVQAAYDLERKQNQITSLNKNLTIQQEAQQNTELQLRLAQRGRLLAFSIVLLLSLVLAGGYWSYHIQQKAKQLLQSQKDEISRQAEQLAELNDTKDKLFTIISHDLRSPVAHLKRGFYQLSQSARSPLRQSIDLLEGQVDHILALLTNLLDWSHSQLTGFKSNLQPIDLADAVAELLEDLSDQLRRKGIGVVNQIPAPLLVLADRYQLHSVLRNVLSNATKFTPAGGFIRLQATMKSGQMSLRVQDTGIGMSAEELARVLTDPLVRAGTENEPGTGLGLRLCRELLARQDGALLVASQPNKGTSVTLTLPVAHAQPKSAAGPMGMYFLGIIP